MATLSIIVPVYNKGNYIDECIQSILNQSFTDFELILVNDGSTDDSASKIMKYKDHDQRVTVIDQENAGVSAARNAGLNHASGLYIGFIDADDTIEPDMFELLIKNAMEFDADISVCAIRKVFPAKVSNPPESTETIIFNHDEALSSFLKGGFDRSANNKIYKAEIVRQIRFEGQVNEDILFTCKAFLASKKTVYKNVLKYNYIIRDSSVSMNKFNLRYMETIVVSAKMVELVSLKDKSFIQEAQAFDAIANISLLNLLLLAKKEKYMSQYNQVVGNLRKYAAFIKNTAFLEKKYKYACMLFFASPQLYTWLMYMYCILRDSEAMKRI
jgi:glycosyltransferase involved in cell wall biosynthesis